MLSATVGALSRLCGAPRGWALGASAQIRDRVMETSANRQLRDWVPGCLAQLPRIAVPARFLDPAGTGINA
eukprot:7075340-Pyramimonas_sp.AAC.1